MSRRRRRPHDHGERERLAAARLGRARAEYDKAWDEAWCFAAEFDASRCAKKIINAHAVQRSGVLTRIAEQGHVLAWQRDRAAGRGRDLLPVGINRASTFRGFCSRHDNEIFGPLDRTPFSGTSEQSFLLCLRALAHESHKKNAAIKGALAYESAYTSDEVNNHDAASVHRAHREGCIVGLREMSGDRRLAWRMLAAREYDSVGMVSYRIDRVPEIMVCGWVAAEHDFRGNEIQDFGDFSQPLSGTACFILPAEEGGIVGLAWLQRTPAIDRLFRSAIALDPTSAPHAILRFALTYSEDCYFAPAFWRELDVPGKEWVRVHQGFQSPGVLPIDPNDDRVRIVQWKEIERIVREPTEAVSL